MRTEREIAAERGAEPARTADAARGRGGADAGRRTAAPGRAALQARTWGGGRVGDAPALPSAAGGAPLPPPLRGAMERAFGADFGAVRVVEGEHVRRLGAQAFTRGHELHFAPGRFDPAQPQGRALLGHELVHVLQQRAGRVEAPQPKADAAVEGVGVNRDPQLEAEADCLGERAARGERVQVPGAGGARRTPGGALQLKGEYRVLLPAHQQAVVHQAETEYAAKAEAFEVGMPAVINAQPAVTQTVDLMLAKVKRIFEAWATSVGQTGVFGGIKDAAYEQAFQFAQADKYYGAFHMNAAAIKRVFDEPGQPLRKKLKVVYNAVRNNNLSLWLKLAAADLKEQRAALAAHRPRQDVTYDTRGDVGVEPDPMNPPNLRYKATGWTNKRVKKGFAARSGLDTVLSASGDRQLGEIDPHLQREGLRLAPGLNSGVLGWAADTATAHGDRIGGKNVGKALTLQNTLAIGDVPDLSADEIRQIRVNEGVSTDKVKKSVKRAFKARPADRLLWEQGGEYYAIRIGSQLEQDAKALHARLVAGVSGSTDLMLHAARHLGMDAELPQLRLVMLGWMLQNRDHSFYEIMRAANSYGVPFHTDPAHVGAEYEDARNFTPMDPAPLRDILPERVFPGRFFDADRLDVWARHLYPTDTLVNAAIPRSVLERLDPAAVANLHVLDDAVGQAAFDPAQPLVNRAAMAQLRLTAPYQTARHALSAASVELVLACLVRHQHGAAVLDDVGRQQAAAADVLASHADATARGGHAKKMSTAELDTLAPPTGLTKGYFEIDNAKARLKQNADPIKLLKKLLQRADHTEQRRLTRERLVTAYKLANAEAGDEVKNAFDAMPDLEVIDNLLQDSAEALAALPPETAAKLQAYAGLHEKEAGAIFKYTTVQYIPIIESLCSHSAHAFDPTKVKGTAIDWGSPLGTLQYTAPMIRALASGLAKLPVYTRVPVFRGGESHSQVKDMDPLQRKQWADSRGYRVGEVHTQPYPMSTSKDIGACFFSTKSGFDVGWQIEAITSGHDIEMLSNSPEESEVLFEPGSRLQISNVIYDHPRGLLIVAREI